MQAYPFTGQQHDGAASSSAPMTQVARMRAAIAQAVLVAPGFLLGDIDVEQMTKTMVHAARSYTEQEQAAGGNGTAQNAEVEALREVLSKLMACGSGYLGGRCDAACVARTMTQMAREFAPR